MQKVAALYIWGFFSNILGIIIFLVSLYVREDTFWKQTKKFDLQTHICEVYVWLDKVLQCL